LTAETPTFHRDVEPILQAHCQDCHRAGGANLMGMVAPMALVTYEEVRPWAKAVAREVHDRRMPPWHAAKVHDGVFANQRTMSAEEIETVQAWVAGGAPAGLPEHAPAPLEWEVGEGWLIGEPDLIVPFDEPYFVADEISDHYETVVVRLDPEDLPEDRWIQAMEFQPGSDVVHHIVIFTDDARESLGFGSMGGRGMLGGMGPGTDPTIFPAGFGRRLRAGSSILFNMHYNKEAGPGTGVYDRSRIAFKFHDEPVHHEVSWGAVGTMAFSIPPFAEEHVVRAEETLERDMLVFALFPHTHLRGRASKISAFYPDGTQELLLDVPQYDFNWQTNYVYREPKRLPAGTRLVVDMTYENSEARAAITGIDPSREVRWGQPTTDEMMYGFIDYTWLDSGEAPSSGGGG
jgi:hypothetical protein